LKVSFSRTRLTDYFILIKESLPLAGAIILNASIARIDWILLGLFSTREKTAEYSFAYKVFELSPFPLLILAPILLSRFSGFFSKNDINVLLERKTDISLLIRMETIAATLIPLVLNITWSPLMDGITEGKYGSVNQLTFFILSCCVPFQYLNNLFWTVNFAQNRLGLIFRITAITFFVILTGDLLFIPLFNTTGAAIVYLLATITEYLNYLWTSSLSRLRETWLSLLICMLSAICCGLGAFYVTDSLLTRILISLPAFCFLLVATKQLGKPDMVYMLRFFKK
jgi:O-antigen/teichoic acid export membrane protein